MGTLARRIVIVSVVVAAVLGLSLWLTWNSVLYSHPLSSRHKLTIRTSPAPSIDEVKLDVTYHYPPAIGTFMVAEQVVRHPNEDITFTHRADPENGLLCIHDNNHLGFLLLYHEPSDDLWDTTGRSGGWNGSDKTLWQERLTVLRKKWPSIPYPHLPE